jgi:hypothetical protein
MEAEALKDLERKIQSWFDEESQNPLSEDKNPSKGTQTRAKKSLVQRKRTKVKEQGTLASSKG